MPPSVTVPRSHSPTPQANVTSMSSSPLSHRALKHGKTKATLTQRRLGASSSSKNGKVTGATSSSENGNSREAHSTEIISANVTPNIPDAMVDTTNTTAASMNMNMNPLLAGNTMLGGNTGMGMYGSGGYGMMMGSPPYYGGGMMPGNSGGAQPFSGLNQFLFSVQSVIFSMGQAVQIMGMNTQALHQLLDTATTMFEHALSSWKEIRALETTGTAMETEEGKRKRRRLKALRWAMTLGLAFAAYKLVRRFLLSRRRKGRYRPFVEGAGPAHSYDKGNHATGGGYYDGNYSAGALTSAPGYFGSNYGSHATSMQSPQYSTYGPQTNAYGPPGSSSQYGYGGGGYF